MLQVIKPLDQYNRTKAYQAAEKALAQWIGAMPTREQFAHHARSMYPRQVTIGVTVICLFLLAASFVPSAIRLFQIGSQTFGLAIPEQGSMIAVGVSTILLSETGQVGFMLALSVLGEQASTLARAFLYASALASTAVALVGNLQVVSPWEVGRAFAWIEAVIPPVLVLSTSYVLKQQMLNAIRERHANEQAYQQALHAWELETSNLDRHPDFTRFYANALIDQLARFNRSKLAREQLLALNEYERYVLYQRELQADSWYATGAEQAVLIEAEAKVSEQAKQTPRASGGGGSHTGEVDNADIQILDGLHFATCPRCSKTMEGKPSKLQAQRALAAHIGKAHREVAVQS